MQSVLDVLREEMVGLVKIWEAALEPSDSALDIPSPVGLTATSMVVFRRSLNGFMASFESSRDSPSCSANGCSVFGLMCGDAMMFVPSLTPDSKSQLGMSAPDVFPLFLLPSLKRSAGAFGC